MHSNPFPLLDAKPVTATVCSYFGYTQDVYTLMQNLSHTSRTCIVSTNGLNGFLEELTPEEMLNKLFYTGKLEEKIGLNETIYNNVKG